jgi:hypothetical protein
MVIACLRATDLEITGRSARRGSTRNAGRATVPALRAADLHRALSAAAWSALRATSTTCAARPGGAWRRLPRRPLTDPEADPARLARAAEWYGASQSPRLRRRRSGPPNAFGSGKRARPRARGSRGRRDALGYPKLATDSAMRRSEVHRHRDVARRTDYELACLRAPIAIVRSPVMVEAKPATARTGPRG